MRADLPTGTVTFLFTDIEGSTRLLHASARTPTRTHSRSTGVSFAMHSSRMVASRSTRRATPSSSPSRPRDSAARRGARSKVALARRTDLRAHGPAHRDADSDAARDTSASTSTAARVSGALAHGGQIVLSPATAALLDGESYATSACTGSRTSTARSGSFSSGYGDFPPLRTPGTVELPIPATGFLGRERELFDAVSRRVRARPAGTQRPRARRHGQDALCARALPPARRGRGRRYGLLRARTAPGARTSCWRRSRTGWARPRPRSARSPPAWARSAPTSSWTTSSTCFPTRRASSPSSSRPRPLCDSSSRVGKPSASKARRARPATPLRRARPWRSSRSRPGGPSRPRGGRRRRRALCPSRPASARARARRLAYEAPRAEGAPRPARRAPRSSQRNA